MDNRKIISVFLGIIAILALILTALFVLKNPPPSGNNKPVEETSEGKISNISNAQKTITIIDSNNKKTDLIVTAETKLLDKNSNNIDFSAFKKGFSVRVLMLKTGTTITTKEIKITEEPNIVVYSPESNEEVSLPLIIKGEARVFENTVNYRLKDGDGSVLMENFTTAQSPDIGLYGAFETSDSYPEPKSTTGTVEVFDYSAKDGSEIDMVAIPVKFKKTDAITVKAFFGNNNMNPNAIDCNKVFPVSRRIPATQSVARAALEELLKGPSYLEQRDEYFTSINPGVKIQKLVIENETAKVDFDETLERAVGGSCRVAAIRAQITETLKQFPTIKNVVISIDNRTEDILQP